jgi:hypothetical protein
MNIASFETILEVRSTEEIKTPIKIMRGRTYAQYHREDADDLSQ